MINNNANAGGNQIQQPQLVQISAKEFRAKFKSKRECYNFLATECEVSLQPYGKCETTCVLTSSFAQTTPRSTS